MPALTLTAASPAALTLSSASSASLTASAESSDALTLGIGLYPDAPNAYPDHTDAYPSALELSGVLGASAASSSVLTLVAA
jgi:hypothetical protein